MSALTRHHIATPIGPLTIELSDDALTLLEFGALGKATPGTATKGLAGETARQIEAYFAGKLKQFDLPLHAEGTPFRQKVWQALRDVPYGQTRSYGEIARAVDSAPRAVGAREGQNDDLTPELLQPKEFQVSGIVANDTVALECSVTHLGPAFVSKHCRSHAATPR